MGSLLQPVGALPARVYWARRAAVVMALVVVVVVGFLLFRPTDSGNVPAVPASTATAPSQPATPTGTPSPTESVTPTPTGPLACDQTNTGLALAGFQKVKQDAKQPFTLALTNTGGAECVLDLTAANFSLTVVSGSDRIWSTGDCAKWVPAKKQKLKPQKAYEFGIEWGIARSAAGCKEAKGLLTKGTYVANAVFSNSVKARQVFNIVKA